MTTLAPIPGVTPANWGQRQLDYDEDRYKHSVIAHAENTSGLPDFFGPALVPGVGLAITVPPTPYDVWLEWGASLGIFTGGQGGIYTFVYEVDDVVATPRGRALTYCPPGTPATVQGGSHAGRCRVGPSDDPRTFTLNGIVAQEAGTGLLAYFLNEASDYAKTYLTAVAR